MQNVQISIPEQNVSLSELEAAEKRLKTPRNAQCPCGSGKKYKKCCLPSDESTVHRAVMAHPAAGLALEDMGADLDPLSEEGAEAQTPEAAELNARMDALWNEFEAVEHPTSEQMDEFLTQLLAVPPDATLWSDVLHRFAAANHRDLPGVFRRISAALPRVKDVGLGFFYWAAAQEFTGRGMSHLLPEVAEHFRTLDLHSYDADALLHVEDYLLAEGFEAEVLQLAEHFLPIERADCGLMPYAVPQRCHLILELRAGQALRNGAGEHSSPVVIAERLRQGIDDHIDSEVAQTLADIVSNSAAPPAWTRAHFGLVTGDIGADDQAWHDCLRLNGKLLRVAQEAWQLESAPPGCAFRGLNLLLHSVYRWQDARRAKGKRSSDNLLDYLGHAGLEQRLVQACTSLISVNEPRARLLLRAHELLLHCAVRHQLISPADAAQSEKELLRLRNRLTAFL